MIKIKKNPNGDTRTAPKDVTYEQFNEANDMHIDDVKRTMFQLGVELYQQGESHDWTKKDYEEMFYNDFKNTLLYDKDFVSADWYQRHIQTEKHHPSSLCHDDINLLDVIEMIVDCVCAGKSRSGEIRGMEIDDAILKKAFENTVKMIDMLVETE